MPWNAHTPVSLRLDFVRLAQTEPNFAALCRRFQISRKTGYKWKRRYADGGAEALEDQPRTPQSCPRRTPERMTEHVLAVREAHPAWGARKIKAVLERDLPSAESESVPACSTITAVLRRSGKLAPSVPPPNAVGRFEMEKPNELWQMDFKGDFLLAPHLRCYPLTILDDHSRFSLAVTACRNQRRATVKAELVRLFRLHGLPDRMLSDNGPPWGTCGQGKAATGARADAALVGRRYSRLDVWLMRVDIAVSHGRARHPQTQGKEERFHRTMKAEVLSTALPRTMPGCQEVFDQWRALYNDYRPHEALDLAVPSERYHESERVYPERLPEVVYDAGVEVRRVDKSGRISFASLSVRVGKGLVGERVGLRPSEDVDGEWEVLLSRFRIGKLDLAAAKARA
jgi:transposase InsO family protein